MADEALSGGTVSLPVKPDTTGFGAATVSGIDGQMRGHTSALSGIGKKIGITVGVAAAAAITGLVVEVAKTGIQEALDASAGQAQLEAGIKSTGNAANVTVKSLEGLAGSLQGVTGQTDDSIVKAEQLLLTFTSIRNVGADKIFDDATRAATDMAAKFGGDASSQAVLLGKALNDPVKGVTALTRVGVSFTQGQRDSIKAMVDSGNTIGAQKLILGELTKEFGGAAEAAGKSLPGQLQIAQRSFEDFSQSIVETFLPIILPPLQRLLKLFQDNAPAIEDMAAQIATVLTSAFQTAKPYLIEFGDFFRDVIGPALAGAVGFIKQFPDVVPAALIAFGLLTGAAIVLDAALDANPIGLITLAIEYLIVEFGALTAAINNSAISQSLANMYQGILNLTNGINNSIIGVFSALVNGSIQAMNLILNPLNIILKTLGQKTITIPKVTFGTVGVTTVDLNGSSFVQAFNNSVAGSSGGGGGGGGLRKAAGGLTVQPRPGGENITVAEAGRPETVVDTESLNRVAELALNGGRGVPNITLVNPDPYVLLQMLQQKMGSRAPRTSTPGIH